MRILYALQGTGNGHISRAQDVVPALQKYAQVDVLISGNQAELKLPFRVKYQHRGLSFIFGKNGGVDLWQTYQNADTRLLWKDIKDVPVASYDLVINDFEPLTAWACRLRGRASISMSHQSAVLAPEAPKPPIIDLKGYMALKYYAPCSAQYGFHFQPYNQHTFTPVIRRQVREHVNRKGSHVTVYLPAYSEEKLISFFAAVPDTDWEIFSKHSSAEKAIGNIRIRPVDNDEFIKSMCQSKGVVCGAGFETPAEALYLGKKLLVIPMKNQYEQHCNAAALEELGVPVLKNLKKKRLPKIEQWLSREDAIRVDYPDQTDKLVCRLLAEAESHLSAPYPIGKLISYHFL